MTDEIDEEKQALLDLLGSDMAERMQEIVEEEQELSATDLVDRQLAGLVGRSYYSADQVLDILLDVRNILSPPTFVEVLEEVHGG